MSSQRGALTQDSNLNMMGSNHGNEGVRGLLGKGLGGLSSQEVSLYTQSVNSTPCQIIWYSNTTKLKLKKLISRNS